jgi:hypothetical protein
MFFFCKYKFSKSLADLSKEIKIKEYIIEITRDDRIKDLDWSIAVDFLAAGNKHLPETRFKA